MGVLDWLFGAFSEESPYIDAQEDYRILGNLSAGAFGTTMLVLRESTGDLFAGKRSLYDPEFTGIDLRDEVNRSLQVAHPNVAAAHKYYFESDEDGVTILSDFHQGPSLTSLVLEHLCPDDDLRGTTLKPEETAWIGRRVALGLQAIHSAGLVHGDLSPNNVILAPSGPVIIDFGLAKQVTALITGSIMGTPGFIAPELGFRRPTPRSDVFALGAILYFLHFGCPITDAYGRGIGLEMTFRKPRNAREAGLCDVLRRAISIDPRDRFPSASQMAKALAPVAKHCPRNWLNRIQDILYQHDGLVCEKCGNAIPAYANYCPICGHGEYTATEGVWGWDQARQLRAYPCRSCDELNAAFWHYCYACGEEL